MKKFSDTNRFRGFKTLFVVKLLVLIFLKLQSFFLCTYYALFNFITYELNHVYKNEFKSLSKYINVVYIWYLVYYNLNLC